MGQRGIDKTGEGMRLWERQNGGRHWGGPLVGLAGLGCESTASSYSLHLIFPIFGWMCHVILVSLLLSLRVLRDKTKFIKIRQLKPIFKSFIILLSVNLSYHEVIIIHVCPICRCIRYTHIHIRQYIIFWQCKTASHSLFY